MERSRQAEDLERAEKNGMRKKKRVTIPVEITQQQQEEQKQKEEQKKAEEKNAQEEQEYLPAETESEKQEFPAAQNPLETIKQIRKRGLLGLVLDEKEQQISNKVLTSDIPSRRKCRQGNLKSEKTYSGVTSNVFFQEYLFGRFSSYTRQLQMEQPLDYGLEYILCGQNSVKKI